MTIIIISTAIDTKSEKFFPPAENYQSMPHQRNTINSIKVAHQSCSARGEQCPGNRHNFCVYNTGFIRERPQNAGRFKVRGKESYN